MFSSVILCCRNYLFDRLGLTLYILGNRSVTCDIIFLATVVLKFHFWNEIPYMYVFMPNFAMDLTFLYVSTFDCQFLSEMELNAVHLLQYIYLVWRWWLSGYFRVFCSRPQRYGLESNASVLKTFCSYLNKNVRLPSQRCCTRLSWSDGRRWCSAFWFGADNVLLVTVANYFAVCDCISENHVAMQWSLYISSVSYNWPSWMLFIPQCLELTECSTSGNAS